MKNNNTSPRLVISKLPQRDIRTNSNPVPFEANASADAWFDSGGRLTYDFQYKEIESTFGTKNDCNRVLSIWNKVKNPPNASGTDWTTMMPGFPDGSLGWAATERHLSQSDPMPRLYVEYVGMGDSDKPEDYTYSVIERADMVEALWKYYQIKETTLVTFDFSSLVALELLSRQIDNTDKGLPIHTKITGLFAINGGLFADAHSHPLMTTPLLKTVFGKMGTQLAQRSAFAFNIMMKDLWSKDYGVTKSELAEIQNAVTRHNGALFMSKAAGFVDEHKRNAVRWDFESVFKATKQTVGYLIAGSHKDQFEPKQVIKARKVLGPLGLEIIMFPGGHMTTSEHPDLIASAIVAFKTNL